MASSVACGLLIVLELIEALPRLSTTEYIVVSNGVLSGIRACIIAQQQMFTRAYFVDGS